MKTVLRLVLSIFVGFFAAALLLQIIKIAIPLEKNSVVAVYTYGITTIILLVLMTWIFYKDFGYLKIFKKKDVVMGSYHTKTVPYYLKMFLYGIILVFVIIFLVHDIFMLA